MNSRITALFLFAVFTAGSVLGAEESNEAVDTSNAEKFVLKQAMAGESRQPDRLKGGGDIRLREVYFNNIPYSIGVAARGGENHFQRYRFRLWGEYRATQNLHFRGRMVNEFRTGQSGTAYGGWEAMDETIFDTLYIDWNLEDIAFRVGRQDLIYGTGKLILDGTPKDGSRTIYFNAVKASFTGAENTSIDLLAMFMPAEDELAIHGRNRDLVGKRKQPYTGNEAGGGIYAKNKSIESLPFEAYYLVKTQEESWTSPVTGVTHDEEVRHTIGTRLMPKFSAKLDASIELAYQTGDDISAYMIDALFNLKITSLSDHKARVGLGWYYLSGDDPFSTKEEGWNPLWARWPQYSELYVYGFDTEGAGRWSNISMPHVDFSVTPFQKLKMDFLLGYMFAPEADGIGGGTHRGLLFTWWNKFTLAEKLLSENDKLLGHVLVELMQPGDYYSDAQRDHLAAFLRVELSYSF